MYNLRQYKETVYQIIGSAMAVHSELRWGLLEPVYQEALHLELNDRGIVNEGEQEIEIHYGKHILDKRYRMDIVAGDVILELKSVSHLLPIHRAQLCNYLRLTRKPLGILINFGEENLIGERWAYNEESNDCFLVDKNMDPVFDRDYFNLLNTVETDQEGQNLKVLMTD